MKAIITFLIDLLPPYQTIPSSSFSFPSSWIPLPLLKLPSPNSLLKLKQLEQESFQSTLIICVVLLPWFSCVFLFHVELIHALCVLSLLSPSFFIPFLIILFLWELKLAFLSQFGDVPSQFCAVPSPSIKFLFQLSLFPPFPSISIPPIISTELIIPPFIFFFLPFPLILILFRLLKSLPFPFFSLLFPIALIKV